MVGTLERTSLRMSGSTMERRKKTLIKWLQSAATMVLYTSKLCLVLALVWILVLLATVGAVASVP